MFPWKEKRADHLDSRSDTLSQLLAGEQRLAQQLDLAREEAGRILHDAEDYARRTEAECAAAIDERTAELAASGEQRLRDELQDIRAGAAREVKRFEEIDADRTGKLVRQLVQAIVGDTATLHGTAV